MADPGHVERVRAGPAGLEPGQIWDVRGLDLRSAGLEGVDLSGAFLQGSNLSGANLSGATIIGTELQDCDLSGAVITNANIAYTNLSGARLTGAELGFTRFLVVELSATDFTEAEFGLGSLGRCDLSGATGLDHAYHLGPTTVGIDTLSETLLSGGRIFSVPVRQFLLASGVPEAVLNYLPSLLEESPIQFFSCFISFTTADSEFAKRLYDDLTAQGVSCWKYDEDALPGYGSWANIDRAIAVHEKVVAICSESSLTLPGVPREIERALQKEDRLQRRGDQSVVLIPVGLDDFVFRWEHERRADVVAKHVGDFSNWHESARYEAELKKLIKTLDPAFRLGESN